MKYNVKRDEDNDNDDNDGKDEYDECCLFV